VRVLPRRKKATLPRQERSPAPKAGIRQCAMTLVDEANTRDREALREAVEEALAAAGL
jgi:hypothetical protein